MAKEFDLRQTQVFAGMTGEDLAVLARIGRREVFRPGETVFSGSLRGQSLFVVGAGAVEVFRREEDGSQTLLAHLGPGASFGEAAMLDGRPRLALGVACGTTSCWILDAEGLQKVHAERPEAATRLLANLARTMANRLARAARQVIQAADHREICVSPHVVGEVRRSLWDRMLGR